MIENNQLGVPLSIHSIKNKEILSWTILGWFIFILSVLTLSALIILIIINWQQIIALSTEHLHDIGAVEQRNVKQSQLYDEHFSLFRSLVVVGCVFLLGLFLLLVRISSMKRRRVIVCEHGLLQVRRKVWSDQVEVVHWEEIQALKSVHTISNREYMHLIRKEGKPLVLVNDYEDFDELFEQIRQYKPLP
ncbi:hypothetical protein [Dictyobacter arantiisoli]|uniref:hypothetical protein n=1 Tax=Dictyobacter arantiisoli TaxID=2014874 RepID=UPI0011EEBE3C|nr:hypothetical protein [Dictyobacter arantiisoli]